MNFILNTIFTALPAIIPVFVLMCARIWPMKFRAQKILMKAALVFYVAAVAAFLAHANELSGGAQEFFNAYYGSPAEMTALCYAGYAGQGLAVLALMLIVNWRSIIGYFSDDAEEASKKVQANDDRTKEPEKRA